MVRKDFLLTIVLLVATGVSVLNAACAGPSAPPTQAPVIQEKPTPSPTPTSTATPTVFSVYSDKGAATNHYAPSGWMGDMKDITLDDGCSINPHRGATCIEIVYSAQASQGKGWAGIYWVDPPSNWGDKNGGFNLTDRTKFTFWARGQKGREQAEFKVGGLGRDPDTGRPKEPYYDSLSVVSIGPPCVLAAEWRQYTIDLSGKDLTKVMGGFVWVTNTTQNPKGATIYLDDIQFE